MSAVGPMPASLKFTLPLTSIPTWLALGSLPSIQPSIEFNADRIVNALVADPSARTSHIVGNILHNKHKAIGSRIGVAAIGDAARIRDAKTKDAEEFVGTDLVQRKGAARLKATCSSQAKDRAVGRGCSTSIIIDLQV